MKAMCACMASGPVAMCGHLGADDFCKCLPGRFLFGGEFELGLEAVEVGAGSTILAVPHCAETVLTLAHLGAIFVRQDHGAGGDTRCGKRAECDFG